MAVTQSTVKDIFMKKLIFTLFVAASLTACSTLPKVDTSNRVPVNQNNTGINVL